MPSFEKSLYFISILDEGTLVQYRVPTESKTKYSKRIYQVIDYWLKQIKVLSWPRHSLSDLLWTSAIGTYAEFSGVPAYEDDQFSSSLSLKEILDKVEYEETIGIDDIENDDFRTIQIKEKFQFFDIIKFPIMEDWVFDHQHGDLKPRIIGIAPVFNIKSQTGYNIGKSELFWIKIDDIRLLFAKYEIFNSHNDAARLSLDHWINMRHFDSYIVKERNV